MRTALALVLAAVSLAACGKGGDACHVYCEEEADCQGLTGADRDASIASCYDGYKAALSLPITREAELITCRDASALLDCAPVESDVTDSLVP